MITGQNLRTVQCECANLERKKKELSGKMHSEEEHRKRQSAFRHQSRETTLMDY